MSLLKKLKADVVVIGGGASGLVAAVAAVESGAGSVVVLEKRRVTGGNGVFAGGIFVLEPNKQQDITMLRDETFRKAMDYAHWKIDPRLVRALIEKSGDTLAWLEAKGMHFERREFMNGLILPFYIGAGKAGAAMVKILAKELENKGGRIFRSTRATKLIVDRQGRICGVMAEGRDNNFSIKTKSVILATGGFAGNKELMNKYLPFCNYDDYYVKGIPHKGDGTMMATAIGVATDGIALLECDGPDFPWSPYFFSQISAMQRAIWVNKNGERFTDEGVRNMFENTHSLERQPGKISYTIFDENIKRMVFQESQDRPFGGDKDWPAKVDNDLRIQAEKKRVKIARSFDEIAKWMGISPEVLNATIDEYNSFCDKGHDDIFAKDRKLLVPLREPPYYALGCCLSILVTHGGIKVNHHMEALNNNNNPVPGLYAVGVEITGREANTYNSALPGHSFGFSVHSGRIAGENAAKYLSLDRSSNYL